MAAVEAESIGLPFARAVISVRRSVQSTQAGAPATVREGERFFVTSLDPARTGAARLAAIIRGHWGIENKNHWKRDAQWGEDRPRQRVARTAQTLAVLRGALLALIREPCPQLFARHARHPQAALRLISAPLPLN